MFQDGARYFEYGYECTVPTVPFDFALTVRSSWTMIRPEFPKIPSQNFWNPHLVHRLAGKNVLCRVSMAIENCAFLAIENCAPS